MKNLAIFCVVVFGWAAVAGAVGTPIAGITTLTAAAVDNLSIGFSETLLTNVGTVQGGGQVNEIDINLVSIGGTYNSGVSVIPPSTQLTALGGTFSFPGGVCYLASVKSNGNPVYAVDQMNPSNIYVGDIDYPGYFNPARGAMTTGNFEFAAASPSFAASGGAGLGVGSYTASASALTAAWYSNTAQYEIGTTQQNGFVPGNGNFDNTLLASFYVSPGVSYVKFYTDDGNPWNVQTSTGGYSQMGFSYGGGRTDYVEIYRVVPEPATLALLATGLVGLLAYAWKKRR
jgi:hypothetical protein